MMKQMREFKRPDGSVVRIDVELLCPMFENPRWEHRVWEKKKFKREFSHSYHAATPEEIHEAKIAYWKTLEPQQ